MWRGAIQSCRTLRRSYHAIDLTEAILRLATVTGNTPAQGTAVLHERVERSLRVLDEEVSEKRLRVECNVGSVAVEGDATLIGQLVHNLLQNAVRHNIEGGSIRIACTVEHGSAVLEVENDGRLYDANAVARFIEPLHRGIGRIREPDRFRGFGLGLAIAERIVAVHRGELTLSPRRPEGGLVVRVSLPLTRVN
jgi:two-component system sensor histidine kinase VanS